MAKNWTLHFLSQVHETSGYNLADADQWLMDHDTGESTPKQHGKDIAINLIDQSIKNLEDLKKEVQDA